MICEKCGVDVAVGQWPFCGGKHSHGAYRGSVIGDDIVGGQVIENLGHEPRVFYSKKAIVQAADAEGLQPMVRYVEGDKHLTNWAAGIDAYTLAAAAELVTRRALRSRPAPPDDIVCETAKISVEVL